MGEYGHLIAALAFIIGLMLGLGVGAEILASVRRRQQQYQRLAEGVFSPAQVKDMMRQIHQAKADGHRL